MTTIAGPEAVPFAASLARFPDRTAVVTEDRTITYGELAERVERVRRRLGTERRLVVLAVRNDLSSLVGYLAALAGGHPVALTSADSPASLDDLVAAYDPDVVVRPGAEDPVVLERRPGTRHDLHPDLAVLLSTSGSTGSPKLVRLSHENIAANAESIAQALGIRETDRAATTLPMHYCYGLSVVNSHLTRGATLVLTGLSVVDPCFWETFRRAGATTFAGVPFTFELLDRIGFPEMDLPSLRYVTQAGGRMAPETVRRFAEVGARRGWDLVVMYGQTEATARMSVLPPSYALTRPGSIGRPVPGGSFRIDRADGEAEGELVYSGPNVMMGYAHTREDLALGRTVEELRTGDLALVGPDGLYEIVGRRSRFLKVVGLRVDLGRVEQLLAADGVTAVATGRDEQLVVAFEGDRDPAAIAQVLTSRLCVPRGSVSVHRVDELPRLASGKPDYPAVLALAEQPATAASGRVATPGARAPGGQEAGGRTEDGDSETGPEAVVEPAATLASLDDVRRIFAEQLGRDVVADDDTFVGLGGDSLSYVATSVRLEEVLGHLPADWHVTPVRDLIPRRAPRRRRFVAPLETGVLLRAVAIVLVIGTHAKLFAWPGTAHVLIALAGFNFARFQLSGLGLPRLRRHLASIGRVVVPSVAVIALGYVVTDNYSPANLLLLNALVGPETWTTQWHFWFVEMLVYVLVCMAALLALPWAGRTERRFPFAFPLALVGAGLLTRFEIVDLPAPHPQPVLWLFALGWAAARSRSAWQRAVVSAVTLLGVPGFFDDPRREAVIAVGILLLTWLPTVPVPVRMHRPLAVLASASLHAYLTHWLVYPDLARIHPSVAVVVSLAVGVAYWAVETRAWTAVRRWRAERVTRAASGARVTPPASIGAGRRADGPPQDPTTQARTAAVSDGPVPAGARTP